MGAAIRSAVRDLQTAYFTTVPVLSGQKASNFGDVTDVYTGYDFNATARLPRGGYASGGASIGHEVTDICSVIGQATVSYAGVAGVLASTAGTQLTFGHMIPSVMTPTPVLPRRAAVPG
jgi:hypothetical protein